MSTLAVAAAIATVLLPAAGCGTVPSPVISPFMPAGLGGGRPAWIADYPTDPQYYIGIGSSKTGVEGEDMEIAQARALVNLASSISTEIRSELLITAGQGTGDEAYETVDQVIRETVDTNIREVEVVDSYYSKADGYWFYLRLSKAVWESIQREEADRLSRRVTGLLDPVLADESASLSARLRTLWKGWMLLAESPYSGLMEADLHGEEGVLIDLVESLIATYIDSFYLTFEPSALKTRAGIPVNVTVTVGSDLSLTIGEMVVELSFPDTSYEPLHITTGADGTYRGNILFPVSAPGNTRVIARLDLENSGLDVERLPRRFFIPEAEAMLEVTAVTAKLKVAAPDALNGANVRGSFESLIASKLPVELTESDLADYEVTVQVMAREAPPNAYDIIIAYVKMHVSVRKGGNVLGSYESPEAKDGGLNSSQAYVRAFARLIELLEGSEELAKMLAGVS